MRISDWSSDVCSSDLLDSLDIKPRAADKRSTVYTEYKEWRSGGSEEELFGTDKDKLAPSDAIIKDLTAEPRVHAHSIDNGLAEKIDPTPGTQISPVDERPRTTAAPIQEAILQLMSRSEKRRE